MPGKINVKISKIRKLVGVVIHFSAVDVVDLVSDKENVIELSLNEESLKL